MFSLKKYKMLPPEIIETRESTPVMVHRIQALRDIPEHKVKAGELGGLVTGKNSLSHRGTCWVSGNSVINSQGLKEKEISISGDVLVEDDCYVQDSIISTHKGKSEYSIAADYTPSLAGNVTVRNSTISGAVFLYGHAVLKSVRATVEGRGLVIADYAEVTNSNFATGVKQMGSSIKGKAKVYGTVIFDGVDISGNAQVSKGYLGKFGKVVVKDSCYISGVELKPDQGSTITVCGNASVTTPYTTYCGVESYGGDIFISDNAMLVNTSIRGSAVISENASITDSHLNGSNNISGKAEIITATLKGHNQVCGSAVVPRNFYAENITIFSGTATYEKDVINPEEGLLVQVVPELTSATTSNGMTEKPQQVVPEQVTEYCTVIEETIADYESYSTDIVKLIKYPAMVDSTLPEVKTLMVMIRKAKRALKGTPSVEDLKTVSEQLEESFILAENRAQTMATSHLDAVAKKSLKDAEQKFTLAADDSSTNHERKMSFKSGLRELEGIIPVSDEAIFAMQTRVGLLEIEA